MQTRNGNHINGELPCWYEFPQICQSIVEDERSYISFDLIRKHPAQVRMWIWTEPFVNLQFASKCYLVFDICKLHSHNAGSCSGAASSVNFAKSASLILVLDLLRFQQTDWQNTQRNLTFLICCKSKKEENIKRSNPEQLAKMIALFRNPSFQLCWKVFFPKQCHAATTVVNGDELFMINYLAICFLKFCFVYILAIAVVIYFNYGSMCFAWSAAAKLV